MITLSDNLPTSSENLNGVDQSFFCNVSRSPLSLHLVNNEGSQRSSDEPVDALTKLNSPEDLIDYLIYLSEHKKLVEDAFTVANSQLTNSGWCSKHDLENLNLQRDVSLSQIDTKLLQIEEKLNSDFNVSMLNNITVQTATKSEFGRKSIESRVPLSPSLRVLEKKFHLFSLEQQAILHSN